MIHPLINHYIALAGLAVASCSSPRTTINVPENTSMPTDSVLAEVVRPEMPFFDNMPNAMEAPGEVPDATVFGGCEQQPEFPGGHQNLYQFIDANLKMPPKAKKAGIKGKVFVQFTIEESGEITNVGVLRGLGFGCDREAVRLVESMPKWKPGRYCNKPVRVKFTLPILFESK